METKRKYDISIAFVFAWICFGISILFALNAMLGFSGGDMSAAYVIGKVIGATWQILASIASLLSAIFFMLVHMAKR